MTTPASSVRPPAVAGTFYPRDPDELRAAVRGYLARAPARGPAPKALIAPHAGYVYSGPIAASAYGLLRDDAARIRRVVLVGPAHRVPVRGLSRSGASAFRTPLGEVAVDREAEARIEDLPQVQVLPAAHRHEHSLEVQLPFLQELLPSFQIVPLLAGDASAAEVAEVLERLWDGPETLLVISSDLSHYHDYDRAHALDRAASDAICALDPERLLDEQACGCVPIRGLLACAPAHGLAARTLDLRSSGDTAGPRTQVVGYGAYAFD